MNMKTKSDRSPKTVTAECGNSPQLCEGRLPALLALSRGGSSSDLRVSSLLAVSRALNPTPLAVRLASGESGEKPPYPRAARGFAVLVASFSEAAIDAQIAPSEATITGKGPHHRDWQVVSQVQIGDRTILQTNRFTELQNGLHRFEPTLNDWVETDKRIEL